MDEESLIKEILDNPELEAARLVYADWLEERGDQRAEFLRLESEFIKFDFGQEDVEDLKSDLLQLWEKLDCPEWLDRIGIKYNVWLNMDSRQHRTSQSLGELAIVKMIRRITRVGLKGAMDRVAEKGPSRILWDITLPNAEACFLRARVVTKGLPFSKLVTIIPSWCEPPEIKLLNR